MTLRKKIVDHIARTVSKREAYDSNTVLGLLLTYFPGCTDGYLRATSEQLAKFLHSRGYVETSVARRLSTLRLIFAVLVEWSLIESNPAMDVDRPAVGDKAPDFEVSGIVVASLVSYQRALVESVRGLMIHTERLILALIHLVAAGVFLAEVKGLIVRDLHSDRIVTGRGGPRERPVWLSVEAVRAINAVVHAARPLPPSPDAPLFVTKRGTALDTDIAWQFLQRAIVRAGLEGTGLTPAKIHRSAATALIEKGFGWNEARNPSGYRRIPRTKIRPSVDEMECAIARCHPLEFV
jgi:site-specific recombinase XerD